MLLQNGPCQQQDVWQSQRHISGTRTLAHSFASYLSISFSLKLEREGAAGQDAAGGRPTCVRVDEPQGSGQQGPDHEGRKGDAHHRRSVQHVQRVWGGRGGAPVRHVNSFIWTCLTPLCQVFGWIYTTSHPILIK